MKKAPLKKLLKNDNTKHFQGQILDHPQTYFKPKLEKNPLKSGYYSIY